MSTRTNTPRRGRFRAPSTDESSEEERRNEPSSSEDDGAVTAEEEPTTEGVPVVEEEATARNTPEREERLQPEETQPATAANDEAMSGAAPAPSESSPPSSPTLPSASLTGSKVLVPDPGFFEGDRTKFKDWYRTLAFYIRANNITSDDAKISIALSRMRGRIAGAYAEMKLEELDDDEDTYDWDDLKADLKKNFMEEGGEGKAQWQIEEFRQGKQNIADFMVLFESLKKQADIDDKHAIFLLKKNTHRDVIKTILGYPPGSIPATYEEWKSHILSVGRGYESTELRRDRYTGTGITYGGRGQPMEIGRSKPKFNEKGQPKCFNCNTYGHMAKDCRKPKNKACYNCGKEGHIASECRAPKMKNRNVEPEGQEGKEEKKDFLEGSE
jgi:hypothetical protein